MFVTIVLIIFCLLTFAGGLTQIGNKNVNVATSIDSSTPAGTLLLLHCISVNSTSYKLVQSKGFVFCCNWILGLKSISTCSSNWSFWSVLPDQMSTLSPKGAWSLGLNQLWQSAVQPPTTRAPSPPSRSSRRVRPARTRCPWRRHRRRACLETN